MIFYKFKPVDTLFFKGAEPMSMGEDHTSSSMFPPFPNTIMGAIRTAYLKQHRINFNDYGKGKVDAKIHDDIGEAGKDATFSIIGPFFKKNNNYYIPAPYNWYMDKKDQDNKEILVTKSEKIESSLIKSSENIYWAKGGGELISIGGRWVNINDLYQNINTIDLLSIDDFADLEARTGIQLEDNRRIVKEGHLYSFSHRRLKDGVELVFGIDREIDIEDSGVLKLGGEQRFGMYQKIENPVPYINKGNCFLSLSMVCGTDTSNNALISTGKIQYAGGWDMKKGFHKDLKGYYPAGTVFNKKINNNLICF